MVEPISYGEKEKLDLKDKKIIKELYKNARASIATISKNTGIQRDSVLYRLNRMKKLKVIRSFIPLLNPSKLGFPMTTWVNFILQNFDKETENKFVNFLKNNPNVVYISSLTGVWDYNIAISSEDPNHFNETLKQIRSKFSKIIKEYHTSTIIQEFKFDYYADLI